METQSSQTTKGSKLNTHKSHLITQLALTFQSQVDFSQVSQINQTMYVGTAHPTIYYSDIIMALFTEKQEMVWNIHFGEHLTMNMLKHMAPQQSKPFS